MVISRDGDRCVSLRNVLNNNGIGMKIYNHWDMETYDWEQHDCFVRKHRTTAISIRLELSSPRPCRYDRPNRMRHRESLIALGEWELGIHIHKYSGRLEVIILQPHRGFYWYSLPDWSMMMAQEWVRGRFLVSYRTGFLMWSLTLWPPNYLIGIFIHLKLWII